MTVLDEIADELGVHERTLRRGLSSGLIRGKRPRARSVELAPGEIRYLRAQWPLLATLRRALRTEPNVRLAVLIGSAARGDVSARSDVDVVVTLRDDSWRARDRLHDHLARAVHRPVDVVSMDAVTADPWLFATMLRDGRVLVDRQREWPALLAQQPEAERRAARAARTLRGDIRSLLAQLSEPA